jgi:shikimate kinase
MGAGKTTVGGLVADALHRTLVDNDLELERTTGWTAAELAAYEGVAHLHRRERAVLLAALAREEPAIICAAASAVEDATVRARLRERAFVVWLDAAPDVLAGRAPTGEHRPDLGAPPARLARAQAAARRVAYTSVADLRLDTGGEPPDVTARRVVTRLSAAVSGHNDDDD